MSNKNCGGSPIFNNQGTRIGQPNCTDCPSDFGCTDVLQAKCVSLDVSDSCLRGVPDNMQDFAELMLDYICNQPATQTLEWIDLTLNSGWTVPSGSQKPQYALDPVIVGKVHFRGTCNNNTFVANPDPLSNSSPLTLPLAIRPLLIREFHSCAFRYPNLTGYDVSNWLNAVISIPSTGVFIPGVRYESTGVVTPTATGNFRFSLDGFSIETN